MAEAARNIVNFPETETVTLTPNPSFKEHIRSLYRQDLEKMEAAMAAGEEVPQGLYECTKRCLEDRCRRGPECSEFCMCGNGYSTIGSATTM